MYFLLAIFYSNRVVYIIFCVLHQMLFSSSIWDGLYVSRVSRLYGMQCVSHILHLTIVFDVMFVSDVTGVFAVQIVIMSSRAHGLVRSCARAL